MALTIIISVSGIAVNHIDDWNPNVISEIPISDSVKSFFRPSNENIDIFLENKTISANIKTRNVSIETINNRRAFKQFNYQHINVPKKLWTWISDFLAVSLIFLSITGLVMIKWGKGFTGRRKWLFVLGLLFPVLFLFIYY